MLCVHFHPQLPLLLVCDLSAYGIGAILAHRMSDGFEQPISYVLHTLHSSECKYSLNQRRGLLRRIKDCLDTNYLVLW